MDFNRACIAAKDYFLQHFGLDGLAVASETNNFWFFSGGINAKERIGSTILSISKVDGTLSVVNMLMEDGFEQVKISTPVQIPLEYIAH